MPDHFRTLYIKALLYFTNFNVSNLNQFEDDTWNIRETIWVPLFKFLKGFPGNQEEFSPNNITIMKYPEPRIDMCKMRHKMTSLIRVYYGFLLILVHWTDQHLLVQIQQLKQQNYVWNLFKVNNKEPQRYQ